MTTPSPTARREVAVVPTSAGALQAFIHVPDRPGPLPGIVLVDGSGEGTRDGWGPWPEWLAAGGAVVLAHDKPGCGGSPGDWTKQSFADRASESLAAVDVLRGHDAVADRPVGLLGVSQGGWISLLAASTSGETVDFVISISGSGVTPAAQERTRIARDLAAHGTTAEELADALNWIDERTDLLLGGAPPAAVLAAQSVLAGRRWYETATRHFDTVEMLSFLAGVLDFDPVRALRSVTSPVLALFGAADQLVPVADSVANFAMALPQLPGDPHGIAVFPGADHGLFVEGPGPRPRSLAAGVLPMIESFVAAAARVDQPKVWPSPR
jgi:uncharacterized protein